LLSVEGAKEGLTLHQLEEAISTDLLVSLKEAVLTLFGPSVSAILLFRLGELLGVKESRKLVMPDSSIQSQLTKIFSSIRYGRVSLVLFNPYEIEGKVCVKNLIDRDGSAMVNGDGGGVGCYFYKGLIKGVISTVVRSNIAVYEIKCSLKGSPYCEYYFCRR